MKLFQWIVLIRCNSGCFYGCVAPGRYLTGVAHEPSQGVYKPQFGDADPVMYPRSSARFQVKELRRVGYNVMALPYLLIVIASKVKERKTRIWKR